jgi:hypothetical protein
MRWGGSATSAAPSTKFSRIHTRNRPGFREDGSDPGGPTIRRRGRGLMILAGDWDSNLDWWCQSLPFCRRKSLISCEFSPTMLQKKLPIMSHAELGEQWSACCRHRGRVGGTVLPDVPIQSNVIVMVECPANVCTSLGDQPASIHRLMAAWRNECKSYLGAFPFGPMMPAAF